MEGMAKQVPAQKNLIKDHDSTYVKIAKSGGHSGTVIMQSVIINNSNHAISNHQQH